MPKIRFDYYKKGEKSYTTHHLDIYADGEIFAHYEAAKKTDISPHIYDFYKDIGIEVKPVFDGVNFPDCEVSLDRLRELTGELSDFRVWKKPVR